MSNHTEEESPNTTLYIVVFILIICSLIVFAYKMNYIRNPYTPNKIDMKIPDLFTKKESESESETEL